MRKLLTTILTICITAIFAFAQELDESGATTDGKKVAEGGINIVIIILAVVLIIWLAWFLWYSNTGLWLKAIASKVKIGLHELALMRYKGVPPEFIIKILIKGKEAGLNLPPDDLVAIYLAKEETEAKKAVEKICNVMIKAHSANLEIKLKEVVKHTLASVDVEKIVDVSILAHNSHIDIELNKLVEYHLAHIKVKELVETYIKATSTHLISVTLDKLVHLHHAHIDIAKLIDAMIIANDGGLVYTPPQPKQHEEEHKKEEHDSHGHDKVDPAIKVAEEKFMKKLVAHYHSGGKILNVVNAVVAAKNADKELGEIKKMRLTFKTAANIDLAGIDIEAAVRDAIHFKVVDTEKISAYAADGIQLTMKCKVTIRPKISMIIKGAGEETILARINEGLVSEIGLTQTHREILKSPYLLANKVESKKELFEDTAYDIISIDISNIEVGKDIEAELKTLRAKANYEEERVRHLKIESEVQKAMADAFRDGTFSIHDYHKMKNMEADTEMREALSKNPSKDPNISV